MTNQRYSPKREEIITNLKSRCDHPTAQEIFLAVKSKFPNISLATVYRNLGELAQKGDISIVNAGGEVHFDGDETPHYHLVCISCGKIEDVFDGTASNFLTQVTKTKGCSPQSAELTVRYICENCKKDI